MMNTETWSYTIMGNSTGSHFYGSYIDIIIASLTSEEYKDWPNQLYNEDYINNLIDRCYDAFIVFAFKTESRLAFQVLGAFIMEYGGKITKKLRKTILRFSKWKDDRDQLIRRLDKCERRNYLLNFRAELLKYKKGKKVKIPDETVTDVVNKRKSDNDLSPIWRQTINYKIENIEEEVERYYNIQKIKDEIKNTYAQL